MPIPQHTIIPLITQGNLLSLFPLVFSDSPSHPSIFLTLILSLFSRIVATPISTKRTRSWISILSSHTILKLRVTNFFSKNSG
ncbi:hypothetical protein ACS0TY_031512 [Phlomoides rotata]